jgi:hypothetical protein
VWIYSASNSCCVFVDRRVTQKGDDLLTESDLIPSIHTALAVACVIVLFHYLSSKVIKLDFTEIELLPS